MYGFSSVRSVRNNIFGEVFMFMNIRQVALLIRKLELLIVDLNAIF